VNAGESQSAPTPLQLGRPVRCSDGPVGRLSDVVIDPGEKRVTHIVVEDPKGAARLAPAELLVPGWEPGGEVVLACSSAEVAKLATIRTFSYLGPEMFPENDEQGDVGVEDLEAVPDFGGTDFGEFGADLWTSYAVTYDRIPPGSAELRRDSAVFSADGDELGKLDGVLVVGARLTQVVLQRGGAIPIDSLEAIETDRITLRSAAAAPVEVEPRWLALS
jgi:sporulation protein YlmC with PRC-barrel domain